MTGPARGEATPSRGKPDAERSCDLLHGGPDVSATRRCSRRDRQLAWEEARYRDDGDPTDDRGGVVDARFEAPSSFSSRWSEDWWWTSSFAADVDARVVDVDDARSHEERRDAWRTWSRYAGARRAVFDDDDDDDATEPWSPVARLDYASALHVVAVHEALAEREFARAREEDDADVDDARSRRRRKRTERTHYLDRSGGGDAAEEGVGRRNGSALAERGLHALSVGYRESSGS